MTAVLIAALAFAGCASTLQKKDRRKGFGGSPVSGLEPSDVPVRGYEVDVELLNGNSVSGELISVSKTELVVLTKKDAEIRVPRAKVKYVEVLDVYDAYGGFGAGWVALGTVSTISHGLFAILSLPVWLVTGVPTVIIGSQINDVDFEDNELNKLRQFARHPVAPGETRPRKIRQGETGRFVPKTEEVGTSTTTPVIEDEEPGGPRLDPSPGEEEQDHQR
jgi:hypothetical protein